MYILRSIEFNNWGPWPKHSYDGRKETFENKFEDLQPVNNFVYGGNNSGKSSLQNALLWVFNDDVIPSKVDSIVKDFRLFLNDEAVDNADHNFFVKVIMIDDDTGDQIEITRSQTLPEDLIKKSEEKKYKRPTDFLLSDDFIIELCPKSKLTINFKDKNGEIKDKSVDEAKYLSEMFPPDLVDYFFITGQSLKSEKANERWKTDLEAVLGISKLRLLDELLQRIIQNLEREIRKKSKEETRASSLESDKVLQEKYKSDAEIEINKNNNEITKLTEKKSNLSKSIKDFPGVDVVLQKEKELKENIRIEEQARNEFLKTQEFKDFWKILAYEKIIKELGKDEKLSSPEKKLIKSLNDLKDPHAEKFETPLLDDESVNTKLIAILEENVKYVQENDRETDNLFNNSRTFSDLKSDLQQLIKFDDNISELELKCKNCVQQLPEDMKQSEKEEILGVFEAIEGIDDVINGYNKENEGLNSKIEQANNRIQEIVKEQAKLHVGSDDISSLSLQLARQLKVLAEGSLKDARKEVHQVFQKQTNDIHDELRNPSGNENKFIKLTENFAREIWSRDESGNEKKHHNPSHTEDLIIRVCMNLALAQIAINKFPMIFDNPFEPFEGLGKIRFLKALKTIKTQKIISLFIPKISENEEDLKHTTHYHQLKKTHTEAAFYKYKRITTDNNFQRTSIEKVG